LNGIKMVNYDRAIINYKFYVIFTAPLQFKIATTKFK